MKVLYAAERGTPVLLSASVSDNSGNSSKMAAPRRSREIDQSKQHFYVGCDNRCLLGNEYGGLHGREFLRETPSSNLCVTSIGAAIFILTLNHADVIGDQSDAVTQNAWFRCALCAAISGEISILIQTGAESWGRFPVPRICRWESIMKVKEDLFLLMISKACQNFAISTQLFYQIFISLWIWYKKLISVI